VDNCESLYDLKAAGFPFWWWPAGGLAAIAVSFVLSKVLPDTFSPVILPRIFYRVNFWFICLVISYFCFYLPGGALLRYLYVAGQVGRGAISQVRGPITGYHPYYPGLGIPPRQRFSVCGVAFSFDPDSFEAGFRGTIGEGGGLRDGANVEISYVGSTVVRIQICPDVVNGCNGHGRAE